MTVFQCGKVAIICESKSTRNGFKHEATLLIGGYEHATAKCMYLNRIRESFQYRSVIQKVLEKADKLTKRQKAVFLRKYDK